METDPRAGVVERVAVKDEHVHYPSASQYIHVKKVKRGLERLERHSGTGISPFPKKSGKGGKYTWEGPEDPEYYTEEDVPVAVDEKDPDYVDEEAEEKDKEVAAGVVEVAKLAPHDIGVVDVVVPAKEDKHAVPNLSK